MANSFSFKENHNKINFFDASSPEKPKGLKESMLGGDNSQIDNRNKLLGEIAKAKPKALWVTYIPDKQYGVVIRLPHENLISGTFTYGDKSQHQMYIDIFKVNDELQKGGLGTRLLKTLTAEAKYYGAKTLNGHITSESALRTEANIFGKENLRFSNHRTGEKLDITYEQALKAPDFNVAIDISNIDTSNWERPVKDDT